MKNLYTCLLALALSGTLYAANEQHPRISWGTFVSNGYKKQPHEFINFSEDSTTVLGMLKQIIADLSDRPAELDSQWAQGSLNFLNNVLPSFTEDMPRAIKYPEQGGHAMSFNKLKEKLEVKAAETREVPTQSANDTPPDNNTSPSKQTPSQWLLSSVYNNKGKILLTTAAALGAAAVAYNKPTLVTKISICALRKCKKLTLLIPKPLSKLVKAV